MPNDTPQIKGEKGEGYKLLAAGLVVVGLGLLGLAAWGVYDSYRRQQLLNSMLEEARELGAFYNNAVANGEYTAAEEAGVKARERAMSNKEYELQQKGLIWDLIHELMLLGIVVTAGYISAKIVNFYMKRNPPPPPYQCQVQGCNARFYTLDELHTHAETVHRPRAEPTEDPAVQEAVRQAQQAWGSVPQETRDRVRAEIPGDTSWLDRDWGQASVVVIAALLAAIVVIIILTWGTTLPELAPVVAALAVAL